MAGGGIGEAALISAAIGGATSAATGGDPLRGAALGALTGGLTSGIGGALGGSALPAASAADVAAGAGVGEIGNTGLNALTNTATAGATGTLNPANPLNATNFSDFLKSGKDLTGMQMALTGGGAGLAEAMRAERGRYGVPATEHYSGPLSAFSYDPRTYTPYTYRPYAEGGLAALGAGGGPVERMSDANAVGANTGYPMADIQRGAYATPYQQPISQNVVTGASDTRVDPYTGEERLAMGGIASLGGYSDGGRLLRGPGDGVSDSIPAVIGNKQPARLADGEFVVPARIVSELGNGSTDAGARELYSMMDRVQKARGKTTGKGRVAKDTNASKYLPA